VNFKENLNMTIPMIALKPIAYAGKRIAKGGRFEARGNSDARLLQAIGHAEVAPAAAGAAPAPQSETKSQAAEADRIRWTLIEPAKAPAAAEADIADEAAGESLPPADELDHEEDAPAEIDEAAAEAPVEAPAEVVSAPATKTTKRQYRRRDMKAEG
jgi:hypothetical protein